MLNSLVIKNFRMLEDFTVEKLGRVNLIVGKNNSGKSTVLEALRIYAGNAHYTLLEKIAISHDEQYLIDKEKLNQLNIALPFEDLFTGRQFPKDDNTQIVIGEIENNKELLCIKHVFREVISNDEGQETLKFIPKSTIKSIDFPVKQSLLVSKKSKNGKGFVFDFGRNNYSPPKDFIAVACSFIPTQFVSMDELESEWNDINLTDNEDIITQALQIIVPDFKRLAFDGNKEKRWVKVKLANLPKPVPLKSLGDGMLRILQIAIKLVSAQGGFLLIDEFENGLHYSVQEDVWKLLFEMAEKLDIQIFATTHSWDCVRAFSAVSMEKENNDAVLFRMGRSALKSNKDQVIATVYDKERLHTFTERDMEVR